MLLPLIMQDHTAWPESEQASACVGSALGDSGESRNTSAALPLAFVMPGMRAGITFVLLKTMKQPLLPAAAASSALSPALSPATTAAAAASVAPQFVPS